jgi:hypothetical protein
MAHQTPQLCYFPSSQLIAVRSIMNRLHFGFCVHVSAPLPMIEPDHDGVIEARDHESVRNEAPKGLKIKLYSQEKECFLNRFD